MKLLDISLSLVFPTLILLHLFLAPYTKVEESFNIQATHDVLVYGTPTSDVHAKLSASYDHFTFPGAVPRTFLGPVLLAGVSQPVVAVLGFEHAQLVVRGVLGLFNAFALNYFKSSLGRAFGRPVARWYVLLQASQFHVIFYASRTLPNMFAFGLTTLAFALLLPRPANEKSTSSRQKLSISLLVIATAVFRSEIAILLATTLLYMLVAPLMPLDRMIPPLIVSFAVALLVSVPIDSYFWQKPLWPELWGFYYNAVLGSSSEWGTSPWHYYFTSALPRLLLNPLISLLLIPLARFYPATTRATQLLTTPTLLFVAIYSLQPHKEARFIFYVVPPLTAAGALGANILFTRRGKKQPFSLSSSLYRAGAALLVLSIPLSLAASTAMLLLSSLNYPGGEALYSLREIIAADRTDINTANVVPVHADVLACMTGVTLFGAAARTSAGLPTQYDDASQRGGPVGDPATTTTNTNTVTDDAHGSGSGDDANTYLRRSPPPSLHLDKTEDPSIFADATFWTRFDYLLLAAGSHSKIPGETRWETMAVVEGYDGIEVLKPGGNKPAQGEDDRPVVVVGRGAIVARVRDIVRRVVTRGWWIGPRMVPKVYILRRIKEADSKVAAQVSS